MALSGSVNSGTFFYGSYLRLEWSATQNYANNTSTITTNFFIQMGNGYYSANESGWTNVDGEQFNFNNGSYTTSLYQKRLLQTTIKTITHNPDGTRSFNESASFTCGFAGIGTQTIGSTSFTLDTIPRYATISSLTYTPVTDTAISINVTTDVTCDLLEYSMNNGSSYTTGFSGDFTSRTVAINDLPSDTTYQMIVRVRRKDSQLKTTSGMTSVTTTTQNNFMGFM